MSTKNTDTEERISVGQATKLLHNMLNEAEAEIVDHKLKPDRFFFMRPSGFPYCGLRKLMTAPRIIEDGETSDLAGSYFTSVGTAAHTVFQSHVGRGCKMIGDWKCPQCGKKTHFATYKQCECGGKPEYEELEIKYKNTVIGHLDGLVKVKIGGRTVYIVIDYKTASYSKITKGRTNKTVFPYAYNVQQISRYVVLMEVCFNIKIDGWALIYLLRDVPLGEKNRNIVYRTVTEKEKSDLIKELDSWIVTHRLVLKAKTRKQFDEVKDRKLCKSDKDYMDNWHNEYSPCPMRPHCFDAKKLNKKIDKTIGNSVFPLINMAPRYIREGLNMKKIK